MKQFQNWVGRGRRGFGGWSVGVLERRTIEMEHRHRKENITRSEPALGRRLNELYLDISRSTLNFHLKIQVCVCFAGFCVHLCLCPCLCMFCWLVLKGLGFCETKNVRLCKVLAFVRPRTRSTTDLSNLHPTKSQKIRSECHRNCFWLL